MRQQNASSTSFIETIAGFSAGIVSTLTLHPLDLLKTRLQGTFFPLSHSLFFSNSNENCCTVDSISRTRVVGSSTRLLAHIYAREGGIAAFYRGLTPNIIGNSTSWAAYFLFYGNIKHALSRDYDSSSREELGASEYFFASGAAGTSFSFPDYTLSCG